MRKPKPVTAERLEKSALHYLERFATSTGNLRRVLMRKVMRDAELDEEGRRAMADAIDRLLARFQASGLLNDKVYAEGRVAALRRRGDSKRGIGIKLAVKGVPRELVAKTLEQDETTDEAAAMAFARRRRLGPYRPADKRAEFRQKDMAAMGRAGFDYGTARAVIDGVLEE
jgi:regulatory protein